MIGKRTSHSRPAVWRRKTVRSTTAKAKKRKDTLRGKRRVKAPLVKGDIERFRRILLRKRFDLIGDMNGMEAEVLPGKDQGGNGHSSSASVDRTNFSSDSRQRELTLGLLGNERSLLREIDEALKLIDQGKYGLCQATGKHISKARLKAKPWARHCIEYARMREKGAMQVDGPEEPLS